MAKKQRFILTLETAADDRADGAGCIQRLRSLLKRLTRGHGFRCIDIRPSGSEADGGTPTDDYARPFSAPQAGDSHEPMQV